MPAVLEMGLLGRLETLLDRCDYPVQSVRVVRAVAFEFLDTAGHDAYEQVAVTCEVPTSVLHSSAAAVPLVLRV